MTGDCRHAEIELPDALPAPIAAALRLGTDPATGPAVGQVMQAVARTVRAVGLAGLGGGFTWTPDSACAVMRKHPRVAGMLSRQGIVCAAARESFDGENLPARTEMGLAERVAMLCGADLAWSPDGLFRVWSPQDGTWRSDESGALSMEQVKFVVRRLLSAEARQVQGEADYVAKQAGNPKSDPDVVAAAKRAKDAHAFAARAQSARTIRAALDLLRGEPGIHVPAEQWDADDRLLAVANGTLELTDGGVKQREHRREDHLTHQARAAYRPRADRSEWERFVAHVLPDPQVRAYLQRLLGYGLLGGNPRRVLLLLIGQTSTGKSTLLEAIAYALGSYAGSFKINLFTGEREGGRARPDLHAALPRRLIITTEASEHWKLDADQVKRLTGNDTESARTVYRGDYRERRPAFMPCVATNNAPSIRGADAALWRRLFAVPFDVVIPQDTEDDRLGERLREHADGVLAWLCEGFDAYMRLGGFGSTPQACMDAALAVRRDLSLIDAWLDDRTENGDYSVAAADLVDDLHRWYQANRVDRTEQINGESLGKELSARGYGRGYGGPKDKRQRVRTGLRLLADAGHAAPDDGDAGGSVHALPGGR